MHSDILKLEETKEFLNCILPKEGISKTKFLKILAIIAAKYPQMQKRFSIRIIAYKFGPMVSIGSSFDAHVIYPLLNDTNYFKLSHDKNTIYPRTLEPKLLGEEEKNLVKDLLPVVVVYKTKTSEELLKETIEIYGFNMFADFHIKSAVESLEPCIPSGLSVFLPHEIDSHTKISGAIHNAEVNMVALRQKIRVLDKTRVDESYLFEVMLSSIYIHIATSLLRIVIAKQAPRSWAERNLQLLKKLTGEYSVECAELAKKTKVFALALEESLIFGDLVESLMEKDACKFKQIAQSLRDFLVQKAKESNFWEQRLKVLRVIELHGYRVLREFVELASVIDKTRNKLSGFEREIKKTPSFLVIAGPHSNEEFLQFASRLEESLKDKGITCLYHLHGVQLHRTPQREIQSLFQDADNIVLFLDASPRPINELQFVFSDADLLSKTIVFAKESDRSKSRHLDGILTSLKDRAFKILMYSESLTDPELLRKLTIILYNNKFNHILLQELK